MLDFRISDQSVCGAWHFCERQKYQRSLLRHRFTMNKAYILVVGVVDTAALAAASAIAACAALIDAQ